MLCRIISVIMWFLLVGVDSETLFTLKYFINAEEMYLFSPGNIHLTLPEYVWRAEMTKLFPSTPFHHPFLASSLPSIYKCQPCAFPTSSVVPQERPLQTYGASPMPQKPGFQWCLVHHCGTSRRSLWHSAFAAGGGTEDHGLKEVAKEEGNQMNIVFWQILSNPASKGRKKKGYSSCKENNWGKGVWGWLRNDMNIRNLIKYKATSENTFDPVHLSY